MWYLACTLLGIRLPGPFRRRRGACRRTRGSDVIKRRSRRGGQTEAPPSLTRTLAAMQDCDPQPRPATARHHAYATTLAVATRPCVRVRSGHCERTVAAASKINSAARCRVGARLSTGPARGGRSGWLATCRWSAPRALTPRCARTRRCTRHHRALPPPTAPACRRCSRRSSRREPRRGRRAPPARPLSSKPPEG